MERLSAYTDRLRSLPKGCAFTRLAIAVAGSRGDYGQAAFVARAWYDSTPQVAEFCKAAVAAGGIGSWGANLVDLQVASSEFLALVQPRTVLGRLQRLKHLPFLVASLRSSGVLGAGWVAAGSPIPLSALSLSRVSLGKSSIATMMVITTELARAMSPTGESLVREELIAGVAAGTDRALLDPTIAATPDQPASLTHGAITHHSTGASAAAIDADLGALLQAMIDAGSDLTAVAWVMHPRSALSLSRLRDDSGALMYPGMTALGGQLWGLPVLTSTAVPVAGSPGTTLIALVDGSRVLLADDGVASIELGTDGAVQLSDSPSAGAQPLVSLWQNNLSSFRVTREINFVAGDSSTCLVLDQVAY